MDESVKYHLKNELSGSAQEALNAAAKAIYFNDSSDYLAALYEVVGALIEHPSTEDMSEKFISDLVHYLNPDWKDSNEVIE